MNYRSARITRDRSVRIESQLVVRSSHRRSFGWGVMDSRSFHGTLLSRKPLKGARTYGVERTCLVCVYVYFNRGEGCLRIYLLNRLLAYSITSPIYLLVQWEPICYRTTCNLGTKKALATPPDEILYIAINSSHQAMVDDNEQKSDVYLGWGLQRHWRPT